MCDYGRHALRTQQKNVHRGVQWCKYFQVMEVIGAYRDAGLPSAAFAAAVPKNWEKQLPALLQELFDDDAAAVSFLALSCISLISELLSIEWPTDTLSCMPACLLCMRPYGMECSCISQTANRSARVLGFDLYNSRKSSFFIVDDNTCYITC